MEAALVTRMFNASFGAEKQSVKNVVERQGTDKFRDVLEKAVNEKGKEKQDIESTDVKDEKVEKTDVKKEETGNIKGTEKKEEVKDKVVEDKDKENKDEEENEELLENKVNVIIENILTNSEIKEDVENSDVLEKKISDTAEKLGIDVNNEDVEKIMEKVKEMMSEKVDEVGPQSVETEKITLKNNKKEESKDDSTFNVVSKNEDDGLSMESVAVQEEQVISDTSLESGKNQESDEKGNKEKDGRFKISDFRKKGLEKNQVEQADFNVEELKSENIETEANNENILTRSEDLQKQIDIIKQVSEQVDVTLLEDKSEMVIRLKPDHLGKVTLQLSIENGNVIAKFLTESEKVKEALEANFQDLKDNLAKQNLVVQDMSVSVGNERRNNMFEQKDLRNFGQRREKITNISNNLFYGEESAYGINTADTSKYWPNSTISFSA